MGNNISTLGQALDQISRLKTQQRTMDTLSLQMATGKKTQQFSGLGNDVIASKRARSNIQSFNTYINNIKTAERRIKLMDNSLEQIKDQAQITLGAMQVAMEQGRYQDFAAIQEQAGEIYNYILELVNTKDGERYLFSGADSSTAPIADNGLLNSFLGEFVPDETDLDNPPLSASGLIGQWGEGTITTEQFITAYKGMTESTLGYSSSLSLDTAGKVYTRVGDNTDIDYTVLGNSQGLKEIITALGVLKSMPPVEHAPGALNDTSVDTLEEDEPPHPSEEKQENFYEVMRSLKSMLSGAIENLSQEGFKLGQVQARLNIVKTNHTQEINTLKSIVSDVEDVDITETAAKITQLQTQLEASYNVTALVSNLSLVNFI